MDPFVTLTAASMATNNLKVATGVCLVIQRDAIQTAKLIASIDQVSRTVFVWLRRRMEQDEIESHGTVFKTRFKKMREQVRTRSEPEYHGKIVEVPKRTWPKPIQKPHPPVIVGGAFPQSARRTIRYGDGWVPNASRPNYADVTEFVPQLKQMATEAGRVPATVPITIFGAAENLDRVKRYCAQSIARVVATLPAAPSAEILPILDR